MQVIITPKAERQYRHLPLSEQIKIKKKLLLLEKNPQEGKKLTGNLAEARSLKAWPYRIIYWIDEKHNKIFIVTIAHRQRVYK
ncbi:type II toxin-antitoxin system RelE/ParE family toxin [Candidatus Roizmanbacteria bacterium]|nr:type II toxin-antitoxin system RelE/ParE family toxin [Candidatus Roizmanbacteria bacterium]